MGGIATQYFLLVFILFFSTCCFSSQAIPPNGSLYSDTSKSIAKASYIDGLTINFLSELDSDIENNVSVYLEAMAFPNVERLHVHKNKMLEEVKSALRALSYYQPKIDIQLTQHGSELIADIKLDLGPAVTVMSFDLDILGEGASDLSFIDLKNRLSFKQGEPFHHGKYELIKSELNHLALQKGYFKAQWLKHEVSIDLESYSAKVLLSFDSKKRFRFGDIKVSPTDSPAAEIIVELAPFEKGEYYSARRIADYSVDLSSSSYFKSIIATPLIEQSDSDLVPIEVKALPKANDLFKIGGGYSTDVAFRGQFYWTRPWLNRWGHSITSGFEGSSVQQAYSLAYLIPIKDPVNDYFNLKGGILRKIHNDTDSRTISLQGQRVQKLSSELNRSLFLRWQRDDYRQAKEKNISDLIIPGVVYSFTRSKGFLDPHEGYQQIFTLEFSEPTWGSEERFVKARTFTKLVRQLGSSHRIITRLDLGAIVIDESGGEEKIDALPSSMRFFAGGDQSIRGFAYQSIAPRYTSGPSAGGLMGGQFLSVGSVEYSYPVLAKWRVALFVDSGTASNDYSEPMSTGSGLGVRWLTPVGPIKLDLAFPVSQEKPFESWQLHFSLGPEL